MYPNSELENYKLQVELLQEKLQRSEQNRHNLEHQLEHILQKRHEIDKAARVKTRRKYAQFLEEQQKRNERNRRLLQMLERVDQHTAALSARSERLKMMKLQYEMYFAKLVQTQTLRSLQGTAAAAACGSATQIPVLVATPASAGDAPPSPHTAVNHYEQPQLPAAPPLTTSPAATTPRTWTLAMATPTAGGMLLAAPQAQPQAGDYLVASGGAALPYEYLPLPLGYAMPRLQRPQPPPDDDFLAPLQRIANALQEDLPTLRAFDRGVGGRDERSGVLGAPPETPAKLTPPTGREIDVPPSLGERAARGSGAADGNNQRCQELLSAVSSASSAAAIASSSPRLTFDKLPKTPLAMTEQKFRSTDSAEYADDDDNSDASTTAGAVRGAGAVPVAITGGGGKTPQAALLVDGYADDNIPGKGFVDDGIDDGARGPALANFRQKINEPWPPSAAAVEQQFTSTPQPRATEEYGLAPPPPPQPSKQLSIENIENAIYGELVNTPLLPAPPLPDIRNATPGLLEDSVAHSPPQVTVGAATAIAPPVEPSTPGGDVYPQSELLDYGNYGEQTAADTVSSSSYNQDEPTYATIDGNGATTTINAEVYAEQPPSEASESYAGTADYLPYAADPNDPGIQQPAQEQQNQQDYDAYANYDATQYDPNAYPGYTYDAATGEYTPDPTLQYGGEGDAGGYAAQPDYGEQQALPYDAGQQEVNYDYGNYAQEGPISAAAPTYPEAEPTYPEAAPTYPESASTYQEATPAEVEPAPAEVPASIVEAAPAATVDDPATTSTGAAASRVLKPTSILATAAEKHQTAAADGQKKKKRVNFVDSSDTDESAAARAAATVGAVPGGGASSESDFEFSTSGDAGAKIEQP